MFVEMLRQHRSFNSDISFFPPDAIKEKVSREASEHGRNCNRVKRRDLCSRGHGRDSIIVSSGHSLFLPTIPYSSLQKADNVSSNGLQSQVANCIANQEKHQNGNAVVDRISSNAEKQQRSRSSKRHLALADDDDYSRIRKKSI